MAQVVIRSILTLDSVLLRYVRMRLSKTRTTALEQLSLAHGIFNFTAGLWPILHRKSFEAVTGPKADFWLVKTVGLLLATSGAVMTVAGFRKSVTPEVRVLAIGICANLVAIDVVYVWKRRISPVYLIDAVTEAALAAWWALLSNHKGGR